MRPTRPLKAGESLTAENSDFHYVPLESGQNAVACFTDADFVAIYAKTMGLSAEEYTVVASPGYVDLRAFMDAHSDLAVVMNLCAGNMVLDQVAFSEYEMIELNQAAQEVGEEH